jgi:hypothetical protein
MLQRAVATRHSTTNGADSQRAVPVRVRVSVQRCVSDVSSMSRVTCVTCVARAVITAMLVRVSAVMAIARTAAAAAELRRSATACRTAAVAKAAHHARRRQPAQPCAVRVWLEIAIAAPVWRLREQPCATSASTRAWRHVRTAAAHRARSASAPKLRRRRMRGAHRPPARRPSATGR